MFRHFKLMLFGLIAVTFFGFAISVNAVPPPEELTISAGPLGNNHPLSDSTTLYTCWARNVTDSEFDLTWSFIMFDGTTIETKYDWLAPGEVDWQSTVSGYQGISCVITWTGNPDDVKATLCAQKWVTADTLACFELN